jgi:hypothetical protein
MSHENAKVLYQANQAAGQKYEYFLTGAIGAMFAYSVQGYIPKRLDFTPVTLEPIAIVCFAAAFICGLKRIEGLFHHLGVSYEMNQALGDATEAEKALRLIAEEPHTHQPREGVSVESIQGEANAWRDRAQSADTKLDLLNLKGQSLYSWRNRLMITGVALIVCARVANPYFVNHPEPSQEPSSQTSECKQQSPPEKPTLETKK